MPRLRPYSRPPALAKLDHRTREARYMAARRAELVAHVGGNPSASQGMIIERCVWLSLHCALLDAKQTEGGAFTQHDSEVYLAWTGSLTRLLRHLGLHASAAARPRSLADHLDSRASMA
jgi:hypothetical protein